LPKANPAKWGEAHGEVLKPMKKLFSMLFAATLVLSLASRAFAQPDDPVRGQTLAAQMEKAHPEKKHHKKKHKHPPIVNIGSAAVPVNPTA
jgi:hypothetical protein